MDQTALENKIVLWNIFNAVKTQIWVAISIYLLVAIMKKRLNLPGSLHTILQILEVNIFEKNLLFNWLAMPSNKKRSLLSVTN
jgi:hypothetical protein